MSNTEILKKAALDIWDETVNSHKGIYLDDDGDFNITLSQLNAEQVSIPIGGSCAPIAAHIEHLIYYLDILELYITEQPLPKIEWGLIWETVSGYTDSEWDQARERLFNCFTRSRDLIENADWEKERVVEGILAVITHTAYHLGQIHQSMCILPGDPRKK